MKIKMYEILEFENIYNKLIDKNMPIKIAYKFSKLNREIENEKSFYHSKLQSIIEIYGEKDEAGNFILTQDKTGIQIKKENLNECQKAIAELSNFEIDINGIKINIEELENFDLTLREMNILAPFIEE